MVAMSVYKGNLHRAPDSPRQWVMPTRKISHKDFKTLLQRRSRALQPTTSNPNPQQPQSTTPHHHCSTPAALHLPPPNNNDDEKEKRKKEVEDKLQILKERKHKLVQVLKQILNAEEELRRTTTGRPSLSLQVDVTNDSASITRHLTPRPASEAADVAGADTDDGSNHNVHSRLRMSSMSPSSESLPRRVPFSTMQIPNSSRGIVASSPSRFAPTSNGQASVSVTGTNYVASSPSPSPSPSPAGSGGTSVFRDAAIASPWN